LESLPSAQNRHSSKPEKPQTTQLEARQPHIRSVYEGAGFRYTTTCAFARVCTSIRDIPRLFTSRAPRTVRFSTCTSLDSLSHLSRRRKRRSAREASNVHDVSAEEASGGARTGMRVAVVRWTSAVRLKKSQPMSGCILQKVKSPLVDMNEPYPVTRNSRKGEARTDARPARVKRRKHTTGLSALLHRDDPTHGLGARATSAATSLRTGGSVSDHTLV
jgi:hypothetical protein